jgi:heptose-I-phosphate ethanolaminephosphotransferase
MGVVALGLFVYCATECFPNKQAMGRLMSKSNLGEVEHELTTKGCANLYLPIHRMVFSLYANRLASQQITQLMAATEKVQVDSCSFRSPQIVLIIGESFNKYRSQLYGYDKPTTPRQLKRQQDSTLIAFTDVVAPWNLTSFVFKHVFSLHAVGDEGDWCDMPMFPEVFRKAGYHVTFITNQFLPKAGEAVYDFSGGFFLNHPQLSEQLFDTRNSRLHRYDEGVLQDYDALKEHDAHQLTIFHLMGQHVDYRGRFPVKTRRKFTPADYPDKKLAPKRLQINADYDNAVLYNDSIVDEIIRRFEHQNAIVIYMPDHGEECFNSMDYFGRNHSATIDYRLAREEFEIPFWIWASEKYRQTHPYGWEAVKRYCHRPYMTDLLPHTLMFLGGIHTKDYRKEYDVLNNAYNEKRPRLLKNQVDYNKLKHEK